MAELAYAADLKSAGVKPLRVRVPPGPLVASCDKSKTDAGTGKKPGPASVLGQITRFFDVVAFLAAFGDGGALIGHLSKKRTN